MSNCEQTRRHELEQAKRSCGGDRETMMPSKTQRGSCSEFYVFEGALRPRPRIVGERSDELRTHGPGDSW